MRRGDTDETAFRRLFDEAYRPLLAYALRRTSDPSDAEEVVAETLLVAWRRRADMPGGDDCVPWLYGVARRVLANDRRAAARRRRLSRALRPIGRSALGADELAASVATTRAVLAGLRRLPEPDREVLRLAVWEGLSHREIGVSLACSENAAALRLHRARDRLRRELATEGAFPGQEAVEVPR